MLILQTVLIYFFYERHWEDVGRRLVLALGGQISYLITELENNNKSDKTLFTCRRKFFIKSKIEPSKSLKDYQQHKIKSLLDKNLHFSLKEDY